MKRKKKLPSRKSKRVSRSTSSKRSTPETLASLAGMATHLELTYQQAMFDLLARLETVDAELAKRSVEALGAKEKAALWLNTPQVGFGGQSALQVAAEGRRDQVLLVLQAIEHGFST